MPFYKREELACMSMWSLRRAMDKFSEAGHDTVAIVVGNEEGPGSYAESLGMTWLKHANEPLAKKMCFCVNKALETGAEYIVKVDSNNAYSDEYIDKCVEALQKGYKMFGTRHFVVAKQTPSNEQTLVFECQGKKSVCGTMQFFRRLPLLFATMGIENVWPKELKSNFDAKLSNAIKRHFDYRHIEVISEEHLDCIDIKSDTDIHTFSDYDVPAFNDTLKKGPGRNVMPEIFEAVRLLDEGYFAEALDRIAAQEDEPSE